MEKFGLLQKEEVAELMCDNNAEVISNETASSATVALAWTLCGLAPAAASGFCW